MEKASGNVENAESYLITKLLKNFMTTENMDKDLKNGTKNSMTLLYAQFCQKKELNFGKDV